MSELEESSVPTRCDEIVIAIAIDILGDKLVEHAASHHQNIGLKLSYRVI